jgi:hypothetical protein
MSKKSKKRNEESSSSSSNSQRGKGVRGARSESSNKSSNGKGGVRGVRSESPNRKGVRGLLTESPNGSDLGGLLEKKLRKKITTNSTATPVAGVTENGTGTGDALEALRGVLDSGIKQKKSKKASKKCRQSDDNCWE